MVYEIYRWRNPHKGFGYGGLHDYHVSEKEDPQKVVEEWGEENNVHNPYYDFNARRVSKRELEKKLEKHKQRVNQINSVLNTFFTEKS